MFPGRKPLFPSDWPRLLVLAHLLFWVSCGVLAAGFGLAFLTSLPVAVFNVYAFMFFLAGVFVLGLAALSYGRVYVSRGEIVRRSPLTGGWARVRGASMIGLSIFAGGVMALFSQLSAI